MRKPLLLVCMAVFAIGLAAAVIWRQSLTDYLVLQVLKPEHEFTLATAPPAPDYSELVNWAAHPLLEEPSDYVPHGEPVPGDKLPADVFYIHPTGYVVADTWNSDMAANSGEVFLTDVWLALQASAFNACCRIYAPEYRQAAIFAFVDRETEQGLQALELAYSDVLNAFEHYLAHENQGRPFIIVSHSQGTAHAFRLLQERLQGTKESQQLVAAYLLGYQLPVDDLLRYLPQMPPCTRAEQTGCILAWDTFREGSAWLSSVPHWLGGKWEWSDGKDALCTNPLTWQVSQQPAEARLNLGALPYEASGFDRALWFDNPPVEALAPLPGLLPAHTEARCSPNGELYVPEQELTAFLAGEAIMGPGNYHLSDFSLFYENIRQNALQRVQAFLAEPKTQ